MIASALIQATNIEPMPENYTVSPYMVLMLVCDYAFSSEEATCTPPIIWLMRCTFGRNTAQCTLATLRLSCLRRAQRLNSKRLGRAVTDIVFG